MHVQTSAADMCIFILHGLPLAAQIRWCQVILPSSLQWDLASRSCLSLCNCSSCALYRFRFRYVESVSCDAYGVCLGSGLASAALVLSIAAPFGGNWWYGITLISPAAGAYYLRKGDREEEVTTVSEALPVLCIIRAIRQLPAIEFCLFVCSGRAASHL